MADKVKKISTRWIRETREAFRDFLDETNFHDPERLGERGPKFQYPEWLIMFIAVLSVKLKIKTYVQIQKMAVRYWDIIAHPALVMAGCLLSLKETCRLNTKPTFPFLVECITSYFRNSTATFPGFDSDGKIPWTLTINYLTFLYERRYNIMNFNN